MPRPCARRRIGCQPAATCFKPRGIPAAELEAVSLQLDELEAVRLADTEGLYHEEAAKRMQVSRQTFDRILIQAHHKIAEALLMGKAILIEGGNVMMHERTFVCSGCGHRWSLPHGAGRPQGCPQCQGTAWHRAPEERGAGGACRGRGNCHRNGTRR